MYISISPSGSLFWPPLVLVWNVRVKSIWTHSAPPPLLRYKLRRLWILMVKIKEHTTTLDKKRLRLCQIETIYRLGAQISGKFTTRAGFAKIKFIKIQSNGMIYIIIQPKLRYVCRNPDLNWNKCNKLQILFCLK